MEGFPIPPHHLDIQKMWNRIFICVLIQCEDQLDQLISIIKYRARFQNDGAGYDRQIEC